MSKKQHNRNSLSDNLTASQNQSQQQPSNVMLEDSQTDEPKKSCGPPVLIVERQPWSRALFEFLLIFAIFFMYGAWPVPDTNEPYYVGKAAHSWHPGTLQKDVFYNSHDTHWLFYKTFGWLTLYMGLGPATWVGRAVLWLSLAFGWYRLSRAVIGLPWASVISAMLFACFVVKFQMAGEWVIGGIEGKVFAYVFVFLGLDALARNRWGLMWVLFGIAAAYHPVVGGWSVIAAAVAWLLQRRSDRIPLKRMIVPLLIGGAISLIGVAPAIMMDRPPKAETAQETEATQNAENSQNIGVAQQATAGNYVAQRPVAQQTSAFDVPQFAMPQNDALAYGGTIDTGISPTTNIGTATASENSDPETPGSSEVAQTAKTKSEHQKILERAYYIATFKRLYHHQLPYMFPTRWVIRLSLLTVAWLFCAAIVWGRKTIRPDDPQALPSDEPIVQPPAPPGFRIACFIVGTILISCTGFIIAYGLRVPIPDETHLPEKAILSAKLLRYYWFRMTDFSIPLGMGLCGAAILYRVLEICRRQKYPTESQWWLKTLGGTALVVGVVYGLAFLYFTNFCPAIKSALSYDLFSLESQTLAYGVVVMLASFWLFLRRNHEPQPDKPPTQPMVMLLLTLLIVFGASVPMLLDRMQRRLYPNVPRTVLFSRSSNDYRSWREMCGWIKENTPEDAVFFVPRRDESFKWYANRANVSTWKEMPQDAVSMVKWYETMTDCYSLNLPEEELKKIDVNFAPLSLIVKAKTRSELIALQEKYGFSYIVAERKPELDLPVLFTTDFYVLYLADKETLNPQSLPPTEQLPPPSVPPLSLPIAPGAAMPISEPVTPQPVSNFPSSGVAVPAFRPLD